MEDQLHCRLEAIQEDLKPLNFLSPQPGGRQQIEMIGV